MPLLKNISKRLLRRGGRPLTPHFRANLDRALEEATHEDPAARALREAARFQADEYVAAINRILDQVKVRRS